MTTPATAITVIQQKSWEYDGYRGNTTERAGIRRETRQSQITATGLARHGTMRDRAIGQKQTKAVVLPNLRRQGYSPGNACSGALGPETTLFPTSLSLIHI